MIVFKNELGVMCIIFEHDRAQHKIPAHVWYIHIHARVLKGSDPNLVFSVIQIFFSNYGVQQMESMFKMKIKIF